MDSMTEFGLRFREKMKLAPKVVIDCDNDFWKAIKAKTLDAVEEDLIMRPPHPVTGWPTSDIEILQNVNSDPRLQNIVASRMIKPNEPLHEGMSNEDLMARTIPVGDTHDVIDYLLNTHDANMVIDEPQPEPVVEPNPLNTE